MKRVARWDYSISANEFTTEIWERVYPSGTYESLETGYPRNDVLANATAGAPRPGARRAGHRAGPEGGALHAHAPRVPPGVRAAARPRALVAAARPEHVVVLMRAHYFYGGDGDTAGGRPRGSSTSRRTRRIEDLCLAVRPAGHRLLVADVRLRRARPADRHLRARTGTTYRDRARHVLRPAGRARPARSRRTAGRADRRAALRAGRGRRQCRAPAARSGPDSVPSRTAGRPSAWCAGSGRAADPARRVRPPRPRLRTTTSAPAVKEEA